MSKEGYSQLTITFERIILDIHIFRISKLDVLAPPYKKLAKSETPTISSCLILIKTGS